MMTRLLLLLLVVGLVLGGVGRKWRLPRVPKRRSSAPAVQSASKCPVCDAYGLGKHPHPCDRADCGFARRGVDA